MDKKRWRESGRDKFILDEKKVDVRKDENKDWVYIVEFIGYFD